MQSYPESLKAISIHAPHAYAICMGIKQAEYRTQPTDRRGWVLIHASQSKDSDHYLADYGISKDTIKRGAIIGAAQITDCTWDAEFECYAYHLSQPILFDQPIEGIKGCQAIFWGAKQPEKQAAFAITWGMIEAATAPKPDDISIEANEIQQLASKIEEIAPQDDIQDIAIPGYHLACDPQHSTKDKQTYQVSDSLTQEPLFQVYQGFEGWQTDLSKQIHSSPTLAIAQAREKIIGRIDRSRPLEVNQIDSETFIVKNPDNSNHYAVRPGHPNHHERCECGDAHFRGVRCKHQVAADDYLQQSITATIAQSEFNQYIEQQAKEIAPKCKNHIDIQFTSPDGFYNWEATVDGKTIATIYYDSEHLTQRYVVAVGGKEVFRSNTQAKAENYIRWHYKQGTLPVTEEEKPESCTIEDCKYVDDKGQQHAFRINNQLIGWIWLTDDGGDWYSSQEYWINGDGTKYDDWRECGLKLARLTRNDLYQVVAA
ncbi:MAG: ASCH domain-containing protein [Nostoc sp. NMS2]|uniref:ASCH domain-containing protein n=1 Tax=Nostoc sp. NMS2 TaxID=2815389 RepID=UPI0025E3BC87|nr:ASCH domain-containing protein [Nostoc sp. NMS2]MBN3993887.1 ASCH domain-containing protein [Nostoc sp. NMS2]